MKPNILIHSIAALLAVLPFSHAEEKKAEEKAGKPPENEKREKSEKKGASSSAATVVSTDGTATITIDVNGRKETRTFTLGEGKGGKAGVVVGSGGEVFVSTEPGSPDARKKGGGEKKAEKGPWLGIAMEPVGEVVRAQLPLAPGEGIVVSHVAAEGPAAKAGLQANDILLRFDDQILVEPTQLKKLIAMKKPGEGVKLTYLRKGAQKSADVTLIEHELEPGDGGGVRFETKSMTVAGAQAEVQKKLEAVRDQLRQAKDSGLVVDKREWFSGAAEQALKRIEKLKESLKDASIPKEETEQIIKDLERMQRESGEAIERAKRSADEVVKNVQRAMEEVYKNIQTRKQQEKEKAEPKKKPGE